MVNHSKIIKLPIGLDYHSNIDISNKLNPVEQENMLIDIITAHAAICDGLYCKNFESFS
jgi:hypothetical protein